MYNRYIRNDNGTYTRIPQEEVPPPPRNPEQPRQSPPEPEPHENRQRSTGSPPPPKGNTHLTDGLSSFLRHILDQLHMDHVDTGDLLLLILLFFLFREDADEELLVSLGLLLIL